MPRILPSLLAVALLLAACGESAPAPEDTADLVLRGGHVVTVDSVVPEARAVAIRGDHILAVGSDDDIARYIGPTTEVVELNGRLLVPSFIEGHGHFMRLGEAQMILDLTQVRSWEEIVGMVAAATRDAAPGAWITGHGWHQEKWDSLPGPSVEGVPLHTELSAASPDNPVLLTHASAHAAFANARAMQLAGIDEGTPDPPGGEIVRGPDGRPTGLLRETAQRLVDEALSASDTALSEGDRIARLRRQVQLAGDEALSKGVTTFHDAGEDFATIDFLRTLAGENALPIRLYVMVRYQTNEEMDERLPAYRMIGYGNNFLTVRSIKRQLDGALGSHGALLLEPYVDLPESHGLTLEDPEDIAGTAAIALRHGFQLNTHAIGDSANRVVLDLYEHAFETVESGDRRWRIEHAQHVDPADLPRFAKLGVIAAVQGVHATSDGPWIPRRLGEARTERTSYRWRDMLDSGAVVGNGTDTPVEDIDPIASFYSSVSRRMVNGEKFHPEQAMTRMEALRSYTLSNAYAAFEEDLKGSITPGKLADLVVLSKDIMTVPEEEIPTAVVDLTVLGGQIRYRREGT